MQQIYMVRHGQSTENAHKIVTGQRNPSLTELGKVQAKLAGQEAQRIGIDIMYVSPLKRAQQTAHIIAETMGNFSPAFVVTLPQLTERDLGELEGTSYAHNERMNGNYPETETVKGVESLEHLHARIHAAFYTALQDKQHKKVLLVCHMNIGRMLRAIATNQPASSFYNQERLDNARIYRLI